MREVSPELVVVGAGPAGSSAAIWAARAGRDVLLVDMATFPRDKTCGDGLTPRATYELERLGATSWLREHPITRGVHMTGWGSDRQIPWTPGRFPSYGSAIARTELDNHLRAMAIEAGAHELQGYRATVAERDGAAVTALRLAPARDTSAEEPILVRPKQIVVADGVRSPLGRELGRQWYRDTVYGTAVRAYVRADDQWEWLRTHFDLRDTAGAVLPGYGWMFPLGDSAGTGDLPGDGPLLNVGVAAFAADGHDSGPKLRPLLDLYLDSYRQRYGIRGEVMAAKSALLPMGGAVSDIAGPNWLLIGDAAGCINPITGEGIDYAMETGRLVQDFLDEPDHTASWPQFLNNEYGDMYSGARRIARAFFHPRATAHLGGTLMKSDVAMSHIMRMMSNLVHPDDDDVVARIFRGVGRLNQRRDVRRPFLGAPS